METLTRQPQPAPADQAEALPPAPPAVPPAPEAAAEAPVRTCDSCGAPLAGEQDWCLECGTAAPGRLGKLPGLRAAATVVLLTLVLVGGAVAASYAALTSDAGHQAAKPAPASGAPVVAQAPPVTPPPAATATPAPVTPAPATLPKVKAPASKAPAPAKQTPAPVVHVPAPSSSPTTSSGGTDTGSTTPPKPKPVPIDLGKDAAALYDPYGRTTEHNEPARALDGNAGTSFTLTSKDGPSMDTGLTFDLGSARGVKVIELKSKTPGYRIEIYATDSQELPPDILDTRWAHITNRSNLKASERIVLGGGATKYRHLLMWITTPPKDGSTVSISEATLLG